MTKTARNTGGLFDWLKPVPAPHDAADGQHASDAVLDATVVALFNEQHTETGNAAPTHEMFALLDALSAAERKAPEAPVQAAAEVELAAPSSSMFAYPSDDFADDFGTEGQAESGYDLERDIHALPADGWLISELQYDAEPLYAPAAETASAAAHDTITVLSTAPVAADAVAMESTVLRAVLENEISSLPQDEIAPEASADAFTQTVMASTPEEQTQLMAEAMAMEMGMTHAETAGSSADAFMHEVMTSTPEEQTQLMADAMAAEMIEADARAAKANQATAAQLEIMATVANLAGIAGQSAVMLAGRIGQGFSALRKAMPTLEQLALVKAAPEASVASMPLSTYFGTSLAMPAAGSNSPRYSSEAVESLLRTPEAAFAPRATRHVPELPAMHLPEWLSDKIANHQRWLTSGGAEGKRYRYNGEELNGISFAGQDLVQAQFRGANLAGVDFRQANLEGADFAEADLSRAQMSDAVANRANFTRANFQFADLQNFTAEGANFNFTDLHGARMREAQFTGSSFRESNFQGVVAMDVVLANTNLRSAHLFETIFPGADLRGADLRGARLERIVFTGAHLAGASLKDAQLIEIDYSQADFTTALDVPQEVQLMALSAERTKLNTARSLLEQRLSAVQLREQKLIANLRVLEQKRHQDNQLEKQESEVFTALATHATWLRRGNVWWAGVMAGVVGLAWLAISVTPVAAINIPVLGMIATFVVVTAALVVLSFWRVWQVRRGLMQLLRHRQAMKAALAAQAAVEVANAEALAAEKSAEEIAAADQLAAA